MLVRTGMYHFEGSRTALYRVRYVLAHTGTFHLVLPCTRCTGFQMRAQHLHVAAKETASESLLFLTQLFPSIMMDTDFESRHNHPSHCVTRPGGNSNLDFECHLLVQNESQNAGHELG